MVLVLFFVSLFFLSCSDFERDNPCDEGGINFDPTNLDCIVNYELPSVVYSGPYGSLPYEGQTYKTVVIGTQTWMAENLNYDVSGSKCYGNSSANCDKYGRLYDWPTAMGFETEQRGVCPAGWHIPSDAEWNVMMTVIGGSSAAGARLKAAKGWNKNGNGNDQFGFSALPGGYGSSSGSFDDVGYLGSWWSATEGNAGNAYSRGMYYNNSIVGRDIIDKSFLRSVRCIQD